MKIAKHMTLAACLALVGCSGGGSGPDAAATTFMEELSGGRTAEAMGRIDPELKQMGGMKITAMMQQRAAEVGKKGGLKEVRVVETTKSDDDHAVVTTEARFGDGTVSREKNKMRRVDGEWYVTM